MKLKDIKPNKANPRTIKDDKFRKLLNSIQEFPKMMELRPMVIDADGTVLGGNMRLKALQELGYTEIPDTWVRRAADLTDEEKQRFIIADNVGFGEWDWDTLANDWEVVDLQDWGLNIPKFDPVDIDFDPNVTPETNYSDVTKEQIRAEAEKLASQMLRNHKEIDVMCPKCGNEFIVHE